jgi:hypothetical protein
MALLLARRSVQRSLVASRKIGTNSNYQDEGNDRRFHPVYVHHLSKVALEHLQNQQSEFVIQNKLETGLRLNPDGTFVIHFPSHDGRIWYVYLHNLGMCFSS